MYNYKQNFNKKKQKNLSEEDQRKLEISKARALSKLNIKHVTSLICVVLSASICSDFYDSENIQGLDLNNFVYGITEKGYPFAYYEDDKMKIIYYKKNNNTIKKVELK